jgi:acyl carrier protein
MEIEQQIREYILENFMYSDNAGELTNEMSLFDNGVLDSTGVLELVGFIEETFGIQVDDTELVPENFDSVDNISAYIQRKQS